MNANLQHVIDAYPSDYKGQAVEVGAWDGVSYESLKPLEERGWWTLAIEPNPEITDELSKNRERWIACACSDENGFGMFQIVDGPSHSSLHVRDATRTPKRSVTVPTMKLDAILELSGFENPSVVQVDVEGDEMLVLRGFDLERWKPRFLIVEHFFGPEAEQYLTARGYRFIRKDHTDNLYERTER